MKQQVKIPNPIWVEFKAEMAEAWLDDVIESKDAYVHDADGNITDDFTEKGQDWFNSLYDTVEMIAKGDFAKLMPYSKSSSVYFFPL